MSRLFLIGVFVLCFFSVNFAAVYDIPETLLNEVRQNKKIFEANPDSSEAKFNLAMSYAYTGMIKRGWDTLKTIPESYAETVISTYTPLMEAHPEEWRYPFKLAFGYYFMKDKQKTIDLFQRALEIEPNQVWTMGFIALVEGDRGNTDTAIEICKKALKIEPNATAIHFLLAEGYRRKDQYGKFMSHMFIVGRLQTEESLVRGDVVD